MLSLQNQSAEGALAINLLLTEGQTGAKRTLRALMWHQTPVLSCTGNSTNCFYVNVNEGNFYKVTV